MKKTNSILSWFDETLKGVRRSQRKTLAFLVTGVMEAGKVGVGIIGRAMPGKTAPKHRIKRVDRFLGNMRIDLEAVFAMLMEKLSSRKDRILVAVDWTKIGEFLFLTAGVVTGSRALPLMWSVAKEDEMAKGHNAWETGFFIRLRTLLPPHLKIVLLCDRGFGRTNLAKRLDQMGFEYVIRVKGKVKIKSKGYNGMLEKYPIKKGKAYHLKNVKYRGWKPQVLNIVIYWGKRYKEPLYLVSNLDEDGEKIAKLYCRRMEIEQFFRDSKNGRWGFQLSSVKLTESSRYERLLLIMAFAYLFLVLLGYMAEKNQIHRRIIHATYGEHRKRRIMSLFRVGLQCYKEKFKGFRWSIRGLVFLIEEVVYAL